MRIEVIELRSRQRVLLSPQQRERKGARPVLCELPEARSEERQPLSETNAELAGREVSGGAARRARRREIAADFRHAARRYW